MKKLLISAFLIFGTCAALLATDPIGIIKPAQQSPTLSINSSSYTTAFGVRGAGTSGFTIKHFTQKFRAIEGILGFYPHAFSATVLLEKYANAFETAGLNWYYGAGGHIAATNSRYDRNEYWGYQRDDGDFGLGVDGIVGMEYKIREIPIAISLDIKPFLEVTTSGNIFMALDPGLGIKVTF